MGCQFCFPNIIDNSAIQANFDAIAGLGLFDPPGGTQEANGAYDNDYVATDEQTNSVTWTALTTAGPTVTINIPQYAFVFFMASTKCYGTGGGTATFRVWNSGGNFDLRRATTLGDSQSPGARSAKLTTATTNPVYMTSNIQEFETTPAPGGINAAQFVAYFHAGTALTAEEFRLEYRQAGTYGATKYANFKERSLAVMVLTPTNA